MQKTLSSISFYAISLLISLWYFLTDKLKRTALTHAILNGNANVASYLLYLGADPNRKDSSGNTLVHYAAAYGWFPCLKLLVKDAGAKYNLDNDWKTTPLAIAFLKGNVGIVDYLLGFPETDINFKDDKGKEMFWSFENASSLFQ